MNQSPDFFAKLTHCVPVGQCMIYIQEIKNSWWILVCGVSAHSDRGCHYNFELNFRQLSSQDIHFGNIAMSSISTLYFVHITLSSMLTLVFVMMILSFVLTWNLKRQSHPLFWPWTLKLWTYPPFLNQNLRKGSYPLGLVKNIPLWPPWPLGRGWCVFI